MRIVLCSSASLRLLSALLLLLALSGQGCKSPPAPSAAAPPEPSVKPGVNAEYLKADLDVTQWVERFEREGREIYTQRERIVEAVRLRPGMRVADIGAGSGLFTLLFAERVGAKGKVYAVDIVEEFLGHIDRRAAVAGLKNIETVRCTERSVELPPRSIDLAFICDAYHHFEYPRNTMASIHRALKPGGELVLVEFKRVPGQSSDWVLGHVRAGQEVFSAEIERAGFKQIGQHDFLDDNYIVRFRRTAD